MSSCSGQNLQQTSWHNGGNNYLFLDGHAKWGKWEGVKWENLENIGPSSADYGKPVNQKPVEPSPL